MFIDELRTYCLSKPHTEECLPFDEDTLVFKVAGKMFALISISEPETVNLKCEPERAIALREQYAEIVPGWHMNKSNWNTVSLMGSLGDAFICELIDHSYAEVLKGFSRKRLRELGFSA
jgi:predicted DNA-binding protein (MmcQ/YjbR family)